MSALIFFGKRFLGSEFPSKRTLEWQNKKQNGASGKHARKLNVKILCDQRNHKRHEWKKNFKEHSRKIISHFRKKNLLHRKKYE
jgi:hypothetical protein